ncbi:MAG: deoxyribodipyrimidine photo-lyase, partial [Cyanobacteria bacterium P01_A01_bin.135]
MACTLVWFRRDLRLYDHAPLYRAARRGAVVPVFVLDDALLHHPETASARVQFMLQSLAALDQDLQSRGGRLIVRYGNPVTLLPELVRQAQAEGIYAHVDFERIYGRVRDARLNRALTEQGMKVRWFEPPGTTPGLLAYPRYRDLWFKQMGEPLSPAPQRVTVPVDIVSEPLPPLTGLGLTADGKPMPPTGTAAARQLLQDFLQQKTERYYWQLSYPAAEATSGISPHVKFGVISVRECYQTARAFEPTDYRTRRSQEQFIARLRWGSGFAQRFRYLPQLELRSLYRVFDEQG